MRGRETDENCYLPTQEEIDIKCAGILRARKLADESEKRPYEMRAIPHPDENDGIWEDAGHADQEYWQDQID